MKRRNGECAKLRRPIKRNKITDGIYGSTVLYLKFFVLWALVLLADFLLEFRFEFLWPFWLLLRSVYDSYKYQGLAFSVFFVSIALTSDMICYFFIPVQWLFFAASTYVWVQYVWHTEKGICLPTVVLWLLFAYMEAAVRLRDLRHMPFHLDLCRPFAAHCIGYPVVTLGFGFKSYVSYRIRQRRQREVRKENSFYMNLLLQALPIEAVQPPQTTQAPEKSKVCPSESSSNGVAHAVSNNAHHHLHSHHHHTNNPASGGKGSGHKRPVDPCPNGGPHMELEFTEKPRSQIELEDGEVEKEKGSTNQGNSNNNNNYTNNNKGGRGEKGGSRHSRESSGTQQQHRNRGKTRDMQQSHSDTSPPQKDEYCIKLEADIKRLKNELQCSKSNEQELKSQVNSLIAGDKLNKLELQSLQSDNDELVTRVSSLSSQRQSDKSQISVLERRLGEERRTRAALEAQMAKLRAHHQTNNTVKNECTDSCRGRRRELESEMKQLRRELKIKEERCVNTDRELQSLLQYKESQTDAEMLMQALSALQDKNSHLENSLSAETRIKLDLFSALGEAKRQLEIRENVIRVQDRELEELKGKMAQVLAVMPGDFGQTVSMVGGSGRLETVSALDPNASVYTPKQGHLTTEA